MDLDGQGLRQPRPIPLGATKVVLLVLYGCVFEFPRLRDSNTEPSFLSSLHQGLRTSGA